MKKEFIKGNEAIVKAALLAGCTHYYGYPITPSSEIPHACAEIFPMAGATFIQAESEVSAINMVYGAACAGKRVMTASSSPGISLKQEGVSYLAGSELPAVIVNVVRAGPGLGNIWPEQGDYNQVVKGGGHGNYRVPVLAPSNPQEMCDLTMLAFELADKYLTPVYILTDAYVGQVMEPVHFPKKVADVKRHDWAIYGDKESKDNLISSIRMSTKVLETKNKELQEKYAIIESKEVRFTEYQVDDADIVLVAYGIAARIVHSAIEELRDLGIKVGLLKPLTLMPFPTARIDELCKSTKVFGVIELSNGQMVDDVKLAVNGQIPVEFYGRMGGVVPEQQELVSVVERIAAQYEVEVMDMAS